MKIVKLIKNITHYWTSAVYYFIGIGTSILGILEGRSFGRYVFQIVCDILTMLSQYEEEKSKREKEI